MIKQGAALDLDAGRFGLKPETAKAPAWDMDDLGHLRGILERLGGEMPWG